MDTSIGIWSLSNLLICQFFEALTENLESRLRITDSKRVSKYKRRRGSRSRRNYFEETRFQPDVFAGLPVTTPGYQIRHIGEFSIAVQSCDAKRVFVEVLKKAVHVLDLCPLIADGTVRDLIVP